MRYQLHTAQQLNCDLDTAWNFFSSPFNLSKITPKEMNFVVKSEIKEDEIYEGMEIAYTVSPVLNIPMKWKTIITEVSYKKSFTDFQKKGPYKYWNHQHVFRPNEGGVLMMDTVDYELPLGFLGRIAHKIFVKKKLNSIFDYRYKVLEERFNDLKNEK
ncbi:hypothetical protein EI546_03770 [Aequorivita sp. H23M31]|uniref:Cell division inhibitor n=1 Tax=Aequorivita ciconiae TaxID=2494375 RepID=A0A410G0X4_9FLAO|nr:SRPBCC family protein [Aequorivita sp. H23M31]QAA80899.1 hypothetical protein EI546_03770 [Aequorivita sp. H23M31]